MTNSEELYAEITGLMGDRMIEHKDFGEPIDVTIVNDNFVTVEFDDALFATCDSLENFNIFHPVF